MSTENLILIVNSVTVSCMIFYNSLLQNATDDFTKCESYFVTKCYRSLLQNPSVFLLQNETVLLQNTTVSTDCENFITKCDSYYKMQRLLKIGTEQTDLTDFIIRTLVKRQWQLEF